jgi:anaerobic ribonucleoside-triphosphate reductase activating protein
MLPGNEASAQEVTKLKISAIQPGLPSAGPGIRTEIFFFGCTRGCPGCFNEWVQEEGHFNELTAFEVLAEVTRFNNFHVSIGGGEPFEQLKGLRELLYWLHVIEQSQKGNVLLYTGNEWEDIKRYESWFLRYVDWVVTGPFVQELAYPKLSDSFVGSSNQQVIALKDGKFFGVCALDNYGRLQAPMHTEQQKFIKSLNEKEQAVE